MPAESSCRHCARRILKDDDGAWADPEATGDDIMWRETCDSNTATAEHEPEDLTPPPDPFDTWTAETGAGPATRQVDGDEVVENDDWDDDPDTWSIADVTGVVEIHDVELYLARHPEANVTTCGTCGRSWDDSVPTSWTPAPAGRCPFEG